MKRILVPTDFSEYSEFAIHSAASLVKKYGGTIVLFHVLTKNESAEEAKSKFELLLSSGVLDGISHEYQVSDGEPIDAIITAYADLIVMGSKGAQGLKSFFIGTNAEQVSKQARFPVITVKGYTDLGAIKSIVYPTDMRKEQDLIIGEIKALQSFFDANLHLVKVYDDSVLKRKSVEDRIRKFAESHELEGFSVTARANINETEEILSFAEEMNADLIAMATHERHGLEKLIGGFITGGVINKSKTPIWTKSIDVVTTSL